MQKYYLDKNDTVECRNHILKRVLYTLEYLNSLTDKTLKNELMKSNAYIQKYSNLSQEGSCVVYGEARIYEDAKVSGNVEVFNNAKVYGKAKIHGDTWVLDNARIFGCAHIGKDLYLDKNIWIYKKIKISTYEDYANKSVIEGEESEGCKGCEFYNECHFDEIED